MASPNYTTVTSRIECVCANCQRSFTRIKSRVDRAVVIYCSKACKYAYERGRPRTKRRQVSLTCKQCGQWFSRVRNRAIAYKVHYCSMDCANEARRGHTGDKNPWWNSLILTCSHCGKDVIRAVSEATKNRRCFCDQKCKGAWQRNNLKGPNNPHYVSGKVSVACAICGRGCIRKQSRVASRGGPFFCSKKCHSIHRSVNWTGPLSPRWKGGKSYERGPNWREQRKAARRRDGNRCQKCFTNRLLHVHHIVPFENFGYIPNVNDNYKEANLLSNLITLCASHHRLVENGKIALSSLSVARITAYQQSLPYASP